MAMTDFSEWVRDGCMRLMSQQRKANNRNRKDDATGGGRRNVFIIVKGHQRKMKKIHGKAHPIAFSMISIKGVCKEQLPRNKFLNLVV